MMGVLLLEWLIGEGIVIYREVKKEKHLPLPGQLIATSGVFVLLAIMSEFGDGPAKLAATLGAGYDIAAAFNILEKVKPNWNKPKKVKNTGTGGGTGPVILA